MSVPLNSDQFRARFSATPGLLPVSIDPEVGHVAWSDLGTYHCYEGFFQDGIANLARLRGHTPATIYSTLDALTELDLAPSCLKPSAFIFHSGRCGSTLLVKILARSRRHLVISEAPPHNSIWSAMKQSGNPGSYRPLLLATGRKRLPSYNSYIIKFTSFNIVQFHLIRGLFPEVPALFLYRNPGSTLQSCHRQPPFWIGRELGIGRVWLQSAEALAAFYMAAIGIADPLFRRMEYEDLSPGNLYRILEFLGIRPEPAEFRVMVEEFDWNSKSRLPKRYAPDTSAYAAPAALQVLYDQLRTQSLSDWPSL